MLRYFPRLSPDFRYNSLNMMNLEKNYSDKRIISFEYFSYNTGGTIHETLYYIY